MKADLPLPERRRIAVEEHNELRVALVQSHFEVMAGAQALAGGLLAADLQRASAMKARRPRPKPLAPVISVPVSEPEAPSTEPDLRALLGLK